MDSMTVFEWQVLQTELSRSGTLAWGPWAHLE